MLKRPKLQLTLSEVTLFVRAASMEVSVEFRDTPFPGTPCAGDEGLRSVLVVGAHRP
jgi:hypothetical protein